VGGNRRGLLLSAGGSGREIEREVFSYLTRPTPDPRIRLCVSFLLRTFCNWHLHGTFAEPIKRTRKHRGNRPTQDAKVPHSHSAGKASRRKYRLVSKQYISGDGLSGRKRTAQNKSYAKSHPRRGRARTSMQQKLREIPWAWVAIGRHHL
jgi:hypothetical protein